MAWYTVSGPSNNSSNLRFSVIIWRSLDGISGHNHHKCSIYSLNELADAAAKAALHERPKIMTLPYSSLVKRFIIGKWSDFWATQIYNKLHSVQPTLGCGSLSNRNRRREQLVFFKFCRLWSGHTYLKHTGTYWLGRTRPSVSRVREIWQWNISWSTVQSIFMSDTNVLMSTTWENCFTQFLPM